MKYKKGFVANLLILVVSGIVVLSAGFSFLYYQSKKDSIRQGKAIDELIVKLNTGQKIEENQINKTNENLGRTPVSPTKIIPTNSVSNSQQGKVIDKPVTNQPVPTPVKTTNLQNQSITFQLQSEFLKNEPIAQQIASGQLKQYDIRKYNFVFLSINNANNDDFAYRFINAIKMTGQVVGSVSSHISGQYVSEDLLNRFQLFWGFSASPYIEALVLKKVDSILASREAEEKNVAISFPLYKYFIEAPKNQESKTHIAYLLAQTFRELPSSLVVWSEQNFKNYLSRQRTTAFLDDGYANNYKFCEIFIYETIGDMCTVTTASEKVVDDFMTADVNLHEYAHYLDRNLHSRNPNTSQGLIDTTEFYSISYDINQRDLRPGIWPSYKLRNPNNKRNEFVSIYAMGWGTDDYGYKSSGEDFAESFGMYVTQGKAFRALTINNSVLKQKYDWLKQNVFGNVEYQSGASDAIEHTKNSFDAITVATGVFNVNGITESYPNFVWNYQFLNGSMVTK
ncbi:MAG: class I SAM-dependent methyltransferase [Patescibacteria group bacterium]